MLKKRFYRGTSMFIGPEFVTDVKIVDTMENQVKTKIRVFFRFPSAAKTINGEFDEHTWLVNRDSCSN